MYSQKTYKAFFGESPDFTHIMKTDPPGDITKLSPDMVPDHDILTGGFPCQPFSLAGVSKKQSLGRPHGFDDLTQGTLFFNIKEILKNKRPKAFLLENVKNLVTHDQKKTFTIILRTLAELEYSVFYRVIDAAGWLPQHRERIYIVGFKKPSKEQQWSIDEFPEFMELKPPYNRPVTLSDILEHVVPDKYTLGAGTWASLVKHKKHHQNIGQGFGYGIISPPFTDKITRTLSARYLQRWWRNLN